MALPGNPCSSMVDMLTLCLGEAAPSAAAVEKEVDKADTVLVFKALAAAAADGLRAMIVDGILTGCVGDTANRASKSWLGLGDLGLLPSADAADALLLPGLGGSILRRRGLPGDVAALAELLGRGVDDPPPPCFLSNNMSFAAAILSLDRANRSRADSRGVPKRDGEEGGKSGVAM